MKRLELAVRRAFHRITGQRSQPILVEDVAPLLVIRPDIRILLLRQDRIGDVLVSTSLFAILQKHFPTARLDVVLSSNNIAVQHALKPYVTTIHVYKKSLLSILRLRTALRAQHYDIVIDLTDNASATSALLMNISHARYRLGIEKENSGVYTHVVRRADRRTVHIVERMAALLLPFGIDPHQEDLRPRYPRSADDVKRAVEVFQLDKDISTSSPRAIAHISGSDVTRMYGVENTITVLKHIMSAYPHIAWYVSSAPQHAEMASEVAQRAGAVILPPSTSFHEAACRLSLADLVFTPDTSIVHLTSAFNIPSVVLFMHDNPDLMPWYPWGTEYEACEAQTGTIADIPPMDVVAALSRLIQRTGLVRSS